MDGSGTNNDLASRMNALQTLISEDLDCMVSTENALLKETEGMDSLSVELVVLGVMLKTYNAFLHIGKVRLINLIDLLNGMQDSIGEGKDSFMEKLPSTLTGISEMINAAGLGEGEIDHFKDACRRAGYADLIDAGEMEEALTVVQSLKDAMVH